MKRFGWFDSMLASHVGIAREFFSSLGKDVPVLRHGHWNPKLGFCVWKAVPILLIALEEHIYIYIYNMYPPSSSWLLGIYSMWLDLPIQLQRNAVLKLQSMQIAKWKQQHWIIFRYFLIGCQLQCYHNTMNVSEWCTLSSVTNTTPSWCNMLPSTWLPMPTYCNLVLRWFVRQPDPHNIPRYTEKQQSPHKLTFATLHKTMKNLQDECSIWRKVSNFKPQKRKLPQSRQWRAGAGGFACFPLQTRSTIHRSFRYRKLWLPSPWYAGPEEGADVAQNIFFLYLFPPKRKETARRNDMHVKTSGKS